MSARRSRTLLHASLVLLIVTAALYAVASVMLRRAELLRDDLRRRCAQCHEGEVADAAP